MSVSVTIHILTGGGYMMDFSWGQQQMQPVGQWKFALKALLKVKSFLVPEEFELITKVFLKILK